ncbi:MAG: hypothetical protein EVA89_14285 [Sandaracinaceae bacterium]|nr:MAG: hypothetical protein EVA89_14285 [Sandaracinaceae bacterium]
MSAPAVQVAKAPVAITRRCTHRKLLWTPSEPWIQEGFFYLWALAAMRLGVRIHGLALEPNHYHGEVTPTEANLPEFTQRAHRDTALFLQAALEELGYDPPPCVWDKTPTHYMRLMDTGACLASALYLRMQPVADGLVERTADYPGVNTELALRKGGVVVLKRPPILASPDMPSQLEVPIHPNAVLARGFGGDLQKAAYVLKKREAELTERLRAARAASGRRVLGAEVVKKIHPYAEPRTQRKRGPRPPAYKVGGEPMESLDDLAAKREQLAAEQQRFWEDYEGSRERWRGGDRDVLYPAGTYEMQVEHRANVAEPHEDAWLCAPGDLSLVPEGGRVKTTVHAAAVDAMVDELMEDLEEDSLGQVTQPGDVVRPDERSEEEAEGTELESPARSARRDHAPRQVTHRTRSPGKPKAPT